MSKTYNHLSLEERAVMQVVLDHRCSLRSIARRLRRSASTISRELVRGGGAGTDRRGLMPGATSIDERPTDINERLVPGHWEGDLSKGARNQSQIGTLVERKTLFTVLVALDNATAEHTAQRFGLVLNRVDAAMRLSIT